MRAEEQEGLADSAPAVRPSYRGRRPASPRASNAARSSSKKKDTGCEVSLRSALWAVGKRFRKNVCSLPGEPDIVFPGRKLAVFCDGDFWHGRDWEARRQKLRQGTNADYWVGKIERNLERDRQNTRLLEGLGWTVLRFWESDITANPAVVAAAVARVLAELTLS